MRVAGSSSSSPARAPPPHEVDQLIDQRLRARALGPHDHGVAQLSVAQPGSGHLRATEIDADQLAHRSDAAAASSRTVTSPANGATINADMYGSGRVPGPNAA
jgi:hypothetical protein